MTPEDQAFQDRLTEAFSALEQISANPDYTPELLLGSYATIANLAARAQDAGELEPDQKIETELKVAKRAGAIALGKKDVTTAGTMRIHEEHCEVILDLMNGPATESPAAPTPTSTSKSGKSKK